MRFLAVGLWIVLCCLVQASAADAQTQSRRVRLSFTPTQRAQIAVWIESADAKRFQTVRLTQSVSVRGIGNRPGALQMNSGYRWPYGRREGVLPIWAHRRVDAGGATFNRVVFNGRISEGAASSAGSPHEPPNTIDEYYCLSFTNENSDRDHLDAVACASQFASNKGRYVDAQDISNGYAEPYESAPGVGTMRALTRESLYPPRRDIPVCPYENCDDHHDVRSYNADAHTAMPEIDAVTMATPGADIEQHIVFDVPEAWPDGEYVAYLEVNTEGDYNAQHDDTTNPTPVSPDGIWDYWAIQFGYPYRGQPSVLYRVPFTLAATGGAWRTAQPAGYGAMHGEDGEIHVMDGSITDDPAQAPGSGADRLRLDGSERLTVDVFPWDACRRPNPPVTCGQECDPNDAASCGADFVCSSAGTCIGVCEAPGAEDDERCGDECDPSDPTSCGDLVCADDGTCVGMCSIDARPETIGALTITAHEDKRDAHRYARLQFVVPQSQRGISRYELRVGTEPITDVASFETALPAVQANPEAAELMLPITGAANETIDVYFGGLIPEVHYYVGLRSYDDCNSASEIVVAEHTTPKQFFTTVTACFVATAAYGSPMAEEIGVLRGFRDRYLLSNAVGRALVDAYYSVGPTLADVIREHEWMRSAVRSMLAPLIALLKQ